MSRRLGSLVLGLLLAITWPGILRPAQAQVSSAQVPSAQVPSAQVSGRPPAKVIERRVRLGHKPVRYASERRTEVRLTFRGRRGQLVELVHASYPRACGKRVLFHRGSWVRPWAAGYWRLQRSGTYTAVVKPCREAFTLTGITVQVRRVVLHQAPRVNAGTIKVRGAKRAGHLIGVRVRRGQRLTVHASNHRDELVLPDGSVAAYVGGRRVVLEPGSLIGYPSRVDAAGRHWLSVPPGATIRVSRAASYEAAVDGPGIALDNRGVRDREHVVSFTGRAGQWIYPELLTGDGEQVAPGRARVRLLGARGDDHKNRVETQCGGYSGTNCLLQEPGPWLLTSPGTYRMSVSVGSSSADATFALRVRAAAVADPASLDGPPVTYASATPGQWVVGTLADEAAMKAFTASVTPLGSAPSDWKMSLVPGFVPQCSPEDTSLGCGDYFYKTLTPRLPSADAYLYGGSGRPLAVLSVPPGVQGSLQLSLSSSVKTSRG